MTRFPATYARAKEAEMNRRQRRPLEALTDGLEQIRQEGQGVWQMSIYGPEAAPDLVHAALCGDGYASAVVRALAATPWSATSSPRQRRCRCCA